MTFTRPLLSLLALLLLSPGGPPLRAQESDREGPPTFQRTYNFGILEWEAAEAIAWDACPEEGRDYWCRVDHAMPRRITVTADVATHARIAAAIAAADSVPASQLFQVVLLEAENNGDAGLGKIPAEARLALEDAREFLPYSGYKMLGTALLRTDAVARSIVNGPQGQDYEASVAYDDRVDRDGHRLVVRQFELLRLVPSPAGGGYSQEIQVITTSFSMRPGETVIVGTSKLEGEDKALVVLLTSVR